MSAIVCMDLLIISMIPAHFFYISYSLGNHPQLVVLVVDNAVHRSMEEDVNSVLGVLGGYELGRLVDLC